MWKTLTEFPAPGSGPSPGPVLAGIWQSEPADGNFVYLCLCQSLKWSAVLSWSQNRSLLLYIYRGCNGNCMENLANSISTKTLKLTSLVLGLINSMCLLTQCPEKKPESFNILQEAFCLTLIMETLRTTQNVGLSVTYWLYRIMTAESNAQIPVVVVVAVVVIKGCCWNN